jgi:hypothetical protein
VIVWHGIYNFVGATEAAAGPVAATIHGVTLVFPNSSHGTAATDQSSQCSQRRLV